MRGGAAPRIGLLLAATFVQAGAAARLVAVEPAAAPVATRGAVGATAAGDPYPNVVVERDVRLTMRDGVELGATLFRPDAEGRFPALVYRTPYGQESYGQEPVFPLKAAHRGYLVFLVDVRGRYTSEGEFEAYRNEKRDGYDTIEAAAAHPRSNGKVGSWGGSYPGIVQWLALSQDPPHYATAVPAMTPTSSHHFFYLGGAFNLTWFDWFMPLIVPDLRRRAGDDSGPWDEDAAYEQWTPVRRDWYLRRPLTGPDLLRRHAPYYYEWLAHPDESEWWSFAEVESDFARMRVPVQLVSGWYDNSYGTIGATRGFNGMRDHAATPDARARTKLMLGPWTHTSLRVDRTVFGDLDFGLSAGIDYDAFLLRWFDARLRGIANGVDEEPPVRIFVMGENRWRTEQEWPPARARETPLYLHSDGHAATAAGDGRLARIAPGDEGAPSAAAADTYTYDPAHPVWDERFEDPGPHEQTPFASRADVLVFTSAVLEEDLEVTGAILADLYVSVDRPDTDLAVMLCDVHPDGASYNLTGPESGYLRLRYRDGNERQVPLRPGEVTRVRIGNMFTSNLFRKGHRIRVQITSSRAPHFDPNPNTGEEIATATRLVPATVTIHHDAERPSRILLPVIPREEP